MTNPFAVAISYLLEGYKKAHGPAGPPQNPELKTALYEAATFLEAAGGVNRENSLAALKDAIEEATGRAPEDYTKGLLDAQKIMSALPDTEEK